MTEKHITNVNGQTYVFFLKDGVFNVLAYKNGTPMKVNFEFVPKEEKNQVLNRAVENIIRLVADDIAKEIDRGKYNSFEEIEKDLQKKTASINVGELQNILKIIEIDSAETYAESLKYLKERFEIQNGAFEQKKEKVENSLDVDLQRIFSENGIKEYEVNSSNSVITYVVNGIPHTINNTNPSLSIYEVIVSQLEFDKITSKEELDKEIQATIINEAEHSYTQNRTAYNSNNLDPEIQNLIDYVKDNYGITNVYGVEIVENNALGGMVMMDLGEKQGWVPIFIEIDPRTGKREVRLGLEKQIDGKDNVSVTRNQYSSEDLEKNEELNSFNLDKMFETIYLKLLHSEELTQNEEEFLLPYKKDEVFDTLPEDKKEICLASLELYDAGYQLKNPQPTKDKPKVLQKAKPKEKLDQAAFVQVTLVTFLSGLVTGLFVFLFFKLFV